MSDKWMTIDSAPRDWGPGQVFLWGRGYGSYDEPEEIAKQEPRSWELHHSYEWDGEMVFVPTEAPRIDETLYVQATHYLIRPPLPPTLKGTSHD